MREIKFRCFDGGEMVEAERIQFNASGLQAFVLDKVVRECGGEIHHDLKWVELSGPIMQFTGLHDKNGKEIYEGDFVKDQGDNHLLVKWDQHCCEYQMDHDSGIQALTGDCQGWVEVIGNIHENPDLLK